VRARLWPLLVLLVLVLVLPLPVCASFASSHCTPYQWSAHGSPTIHLPVWLYTSVCGLYFQCAPPRAEYISSSTVTSVGSSKRRGAGGVGGEGGGLGADGGSIEAARMVTLAIEPSQFCVVGFAAFGRPPTAIASAPE
jgi:hypothetical protein